MRTWSAPQLTGRNFKALVRSPLKLSWERFEEGHPEVDLPNSFQLTKEEAAYQSTDQARSRQGFADD